MSVNGTAGGKSAEQVDAQQHVVRLEALHSEYHRLLHAMQSGVKFALQHDPSAGTPKHLRVGVNSVHVSHGALVALLLRKGLITELEYYEELVAAMRREVESYERLLTEQCGLKVTLL